MSWTSSDGLEDKATQLRVQRLWAQDWQSSGMGAKRLRGLNDVRVGLPGWGGG